MKQRNAWFILLLIFTFSICLTSLAAMNDNLPRLALISYADCIQGGSLFGNDKGRQWHKDVVIDVFREEIGKRFSNGKLEFIPSKEIDTALTTYGYNLKQLIFPEKQEIIKLATDLKADAVLFFELSDFEVGRYGPTSFQFYGMTRYIAYNAVANQFVSRRFRYDGPSYRYPAFPKLNDYQEITGNQ